MNAARQIQAIYPGRTARDVATILGEYPSGWRAYLRGDRQPTEGKVRAWLDAVERDTGTRPVVVL